MNILLVCSYFGPETSVGVNRINAFARYWSAQGCVIDVVTMPYSGRLPDCFINQDNLHIHQIPAFFSRLPTCSVALHESTSSSKRFLLLKKISYWLKKNVVANYLDPRSFWWPKAAFHALNIVSQKKIDVILTCVPSYTAHSIGACVKFFHPSVFWVADYRDLWSGNPIFPGMTFFRWIERHHEVFLMKKANLFVTINAELGETLKKLHGVKDVLIIPNGYENKDVNVVKVLPHQNEKKDHLSIVYTGTVLYGLQNPEPFFQALANVIREGAIHDKVVKLYFYGDASAIVPTDAYLFLLDQKIIQLMGRVSREESLIAQKRADMLLFLGARPVKDGVNIKGVVSGKIFEYLIADVEILGIGVTEDMLVGEMIQLSGLGHIYGNDVEQMEKRLIEFLKKGPIKVTANQVYLSQFNREKQTIKLLQEIKKNLNIVREKVDAN